MIKKLKLSEFLSAYEEPIPVSAPSVDEFTLPLQEVIELITSHTGSFLVDSKEYSLAMSSDHSLYFYEGVKLPCLLLYDSIIDIKRKQDKLLIFLSDPVQSVELTLIPKEPHVE